MTKTSTQDVLAYHQRKLNAGLKELRRLYVYPADETAAREFAAKLTKLREKLAKRGAP